MSIRLYSTTIQFYKRTLNIIPSQQLQVNTIYNYKSSIDTSASTRKRLDILPFLFHNARFSQIKCAKPVFGHFGQIWINLGQNRPERGHFRILGEKVKTSPSYQFFLFFKTKIRKFQSTVSEKILRMETTDREEGDFIGQNPPAVGVGPKRLRNPISKFSVGERES